MRKLIARNAHATMCCAHVMHVCKSAHLNGITRTFLPGTMHMSCATTEQCSWSFGMLGQGETVKWYLTAGGYFYYILRQGGKSKYPLEALRFQLHVQVMSLLSPRLAHQAKWDCFINTRGGIGSSIPNDLFNEPINKLLKGILTKMGPYLTDKSLQCGARTVNTIFQISKQFDKQEWCLSCYYCPFFCIWYWRCINGGCNSFERYSEHSPRKVSYQVP